MRGTWHSAHSLPSLWWREWEKERECVCVFSLTPSIWCQNGLHSWDASSPYSQLFWGGWCLCRAEESHSPCISLLIWSLNSALTENTMRSWLRMLRTLKSLWNSTNKSQAWAWMHAEDNGLKLLSECWKKKKKPRSAKLKILQRLWKAETKVYP